MVYYGTLIGSHGRTISFSMTLSDRNPGFTVTTFLPAGCHGNLPVLNLLSASVAKNQHFRPCRKNYALDRKMIPTFRIVRTFSISMQSLGEIELSALVVRAKIGVFCISRLVCL